MAAVAPLLLQTPLILLFYAVRILRDYSANNQQTGEINSFVQTQTATQNHY
jgi:hypothetical protein